MLDKNIRLNLFNNAYQQFTPDWIHQDNMTKIDHYLSQNNASIIQFLTNYFDTKGGLQYLQGKAILELGCGMGGLAHFLTQYSSDILGVDISPLAISHGREIAKLKNNHLRFEQLDICEQTSLNKTFDYIIDSHLLHCLVGQEQRESYFQFTKDHLKPEGELLMETMVFEKNIQEPIGYELTRDYILYKEIGEEKIPVRSIYPSLDIENELERNGFKINYFYFHNELSFPVFNEYEDYPSFRLPKAVRLSASRK